MALVAAAAKDQVYVTPFWISLTATAVGAVEGALLTLDERDADIVGMMVLAACLGFGGGVVRDVLCGTLPPEALRNPWYLVTVVLCALGVWLLHHAIRRLGKVLFLLDALVLGLFGVVGAQKALLVGLPTLTAILLGAVVSVSGGVLADVLLQRRPALLEAGPPYATASLVGVVWYVVSVRELGVSPNLAAGVAVVVVLVLRVVADRLGVSTPRADAVSSAHLGRLRSMVTDRVGIRSWRGPGRAGDRGGPAGGLGSEP
jgi:uncharacterized membrane protein YeiH